jgi:SAM-dependent methyltransferase
MAIENARQRAQAFGAAAAAYERGRPAYPAQAVDWLVPAAARRVLDLGAGTGKLTGQLQARDLEVTAVEPSDGMRAALSERLPQVRALAGAAEAIPLADGAVDAVLVAQAWHWVDPVRTVPEVARVLAPGGQLGLLWNIRDDREDWVTQLQRLMPSHQDSEAVARAPVIGPPFGPSERLEVPWRQPMKPEALVDLVGSRSYVIILPPDEKAALLAAVRRLIDTHPATAGQDEIDFPYITFCTRARRG